MVWNAFVCCKWQICQQFYDSDIWKKAYKTISNTVHEIVPMIDSSKKLTQTSLTIKVEGNWKVTFCIVKAFKGNRN